MDACHASFAEDADVVFGKPESVSCDNILAKHSKAVKILYWRHSAMLSLAILDLLTSLRKVNMNLKASFASEIHSPKHQRLTYRIYRMDCYHELRLVLPAHRLLIHLLALDFLTLCLLRIVVIQDYIRQNRTKAEFNRSLMSHRHMPVMVVECCSTCLDHLKAGNLCCMVDILIVDLRLDLPYPVDPLMEGNILADAPHHGHTGMCMHVHESWKRRLSGAIHDLCIL